MWKSRCFLLLCLLALAAAQGSKKSPWKTLTGNAPAIIARGGFSGLLPDSSSGAYQLATVLGRPDTIFWCDIQLTKDAAGICFPELRLENSSNVPVFFPNSSRTYSVNGVPSKGFFSLDFTLDDLFNVTIYRGILSRPDKFDGVYPILTLGDVIQQTSPPGLWLNVQHDAFFSQHKLSMRSYMLSVFKSAIVDYVSSPEVNFLKSILARKPSKTKLIFRFLGRDEVDPSINQTYGSLLSNLTFIKTFASGILVPKDYIWPVDGDQYLQPHTSLVLDAHKEGLEIYASGFANDLTLPYDYSYDPVAEYLSFVDNGNFSVDGVVSDFPITPSEAIECFSHIGGKNVSVPKKPLVISSQGSSGDYPGCTDLAYQKAISDGTEVLDCPVHMTQDGVAICLGSVNLMDNTNVAQSSFNNFASIPELRLVNGVPTFNLTWSDIQSLTPSISNPYSATYHLFRNPKFKTAGKFMTLSDFLDLANNASSVSSVLIGIENAAYLAEKQGLGVTDVVLDTLRNASANNQKVLIQSTDSSVLKKFKKEGKYELVYKVDEDIRDADSSTIVAITEFANSVVVTKSSVFPDNVEYLIGMTDVVEKLKKSKLGVYVELFRNEFVSQAWDFFSDPYVEINTYNSGAGIDGFVTEFPGTVAKYKRNKCLALGDKTPTFMLPVQAGGLFQLFNPQTLPPAEAPNPVLGVSDVVEPPLPPVSKIPIDGNNGTAAPGPTKPSGQPREAACIFLSCLAVIFATLALL